MQSRGTSLISPSLFANFVSTCVIYILILTNAVQANVILIQHRIRTPTSHASYFIIIGGCVECIAVYQWVIYAYSQIQYVEAVVTVIQIHDSQTHQPSASHHTHSFMTNSRSDVKFISFSCTWESNQYSASRCHTVIHSGGAKCSSITRAL